MIRLFRHHVPVGSVITILADAALFLAALPFAVFVQHQHGGSDIARVALPAAVFAALMLAFNGALGSYRREVTVGAWRWIVRALLALLLAVPLAYLVFSALPNGGLARDAIGYAGLCTLAGLVALRQGVAWAQSADVGAKRVLIVGTGVEAQTIESELGRLGHPRIAVVGFYPTSGVDKTAIAPDRVLPRSIPLLEVVRGLDIREVIVAVREQRGGVLPLRELLDCRISGVPVTDLAGFYERVHGVIPIESLKASWLIYGAGFAQDGGRAFIKRSFDLCVASLLFVLTAPIMLLTALAVRLGSDGPIIYRQERVGRGGRRFTCLKFRSMANNAEADGVARWAAQRDPRITRVGRLIRATRIDELPQLFNVLRGEMSFVGPRPERPGFVDDLRQQINFYDVRHSVKPGLTGWAQVRYSYGASVEESRKKLEYDLYYVKNHSLFLDLLILFETVRVILFREGAH